MLVRGSSGRLGWASAGDGLSFGKNNGIGCCAGAEVRAGCLGEVRGSGGQAGAVSGWGFGRRPRAPDKFVEGSDEGHARLGS